MNATCNGTIFGVMIGFQNIISEDDWNSCLFDQSFLSRKILAPFGVEMLEYSVFQHIVIKPQLQLFEQEVDHLALDESVDY